jgi:3'-phosphoadenosine 5'-phosphosulfate (PAPS) 3'-phosphatase
MTKSLFAAGLLSVLSVLSVPSLAQGASAPAGHAETRWEKNHPRRDQVNDRLENQNRRIKAEVAEGEMSKAKAAELHLEDRQIRQEERDMAAQNGGHITKAEQKVLNQQENKVSAQIGK